MLKAVKTKIVANNYDIPECEVRPDDLWEANVIVATWALIAWAALGACAGIAVVVAGLMA